MPRFIIKVINTGCDGYPVVSNIDVCAIDQHICAARGVDAISPTKHARAKYREIQQRNVGTILEVKVPVGTIGPRRASHLQVIDVNKLKELRGLVRQGGALWLP